MIAAAFAADVQLRDLVPDRTGDPVVVVVSPGFTFASYVPLVRRLQDEGAHVLVVEFACASQDSARLVNDLVTVLHPLPRQTVVVAHGLGATLAVMAAPELEFERYVLLAPILDVVPVEATRFVADQPIGAAVDLNKPIEWRGRDLATVLLGPHSTLGCLPGPLAVEMQGWLKSEHVPVAPARVAGTVWVGVSLGDDLATVESVLPIARQFPHYEVVRFGLNRIDEQDFEHVELLTHATPVDAAVRWALQ